MKSIIVMGGGIGGLTAAHELSKHGYSISVYERNKYLGGMARSKLNSENLPCSYSWRVYGKYYNNLRKVLSEIPLTNSPGKSVIDNLIDINTYYIVDFEHDIYKLDSSTSSEKLKTLKKILKNYSYKDLFLILKAMIYFYSICEERLEKYDYIAWKAYMKQLSPVAQNYIVRSMGPFYGMDIDKMSVLTAVNCLFSAIEYVITSSQLSVMNAPTNMAWFDHWKPYLESKLVSINTEHNIEKITVSRGKIENITITDKTTNEQKTLSADYYVCGLSIEEISKKLHFTDGKELPKLSALAEKSRQIQLSIQLYLDDRLLFPEQKSVLWLPDSPWALIIESQLTLWDRKDYVSPDIKDILSVGICDWSTKGLKVQKAFVDCTFPEVIEEVWHQIQKCPGLHKLPTLQNKSLSEAKILNYFIWDSFYINKEHKIDTWEPKFSNNVECFHLAPNAHEDIENLFFATAYTKNTTNLFTMDSAAESGLNASKGLLRQDGKTNDSVKVFDYPRPFNKLFGWIRWIDRMLYKLVVS